MAHITATHYPWNPSPGQTPLAHFHAAPAESSILGIPQVLCLPFLRELVGCAAYPFQEQPSESLPLQFLGESPWTL